MEVDIGDRIGFWGRQMKEINQKIGGKIPLKYTLEKYTLEKYTFNKW